MAYRIARLQMILSEKGPPKVVGIMHGAHQELNPALVTASYPVLTRVVWYSDD